MKRGLLLAAFLLGTIVPMATVHAQLQRSEKKTLFVFDTRYDHSIDDLSQRRQQWARSKFTDTFVTTFERFEFIDMARAEGNVDTFLAHADEWLMQHAQELVQLRKEPDGRIGEARVTLDDLKDAVANGYAFVPVFDKIRKEKIKREKGEPRIVYHVKAHIDIYRTSNQEKIGVVEGSSDDIGGVLGSMKMLANLALQGGAGSSSEYDERMFQAAVDGVFEQMKTRISQMDEFSLKAVATNTSANAFTIDLGRDYGVRMDKRYKAWSLNNEGKPYKMEAFGKVRHVHPERSEVQVLIGSASEGDQVIEAAKFGLNIAPRVGVIPWKTEGFGEIEGVLINILDPNVVFTLPPDENTRRLEIGVQLEYNTAWITNVSELYVVAEGSWVPVPSLGVWDASFGVRKKWYFRRFAAFGTLKIGGIGIQFIDTDMFDNSNVEKGSDATVYGVGVDAGAEVLLTPEVAFRGQIGFSGFPKQLVLLAYDTGSGEWKDAYITSAGVTFSFTLSWTL